MIFVNGEKIYVSVDNDVWGSDLVCRKNGKLLWIQATLDSGVTKRVDEFRKYFHQFLPGEELQLWQKNDKGEINIKQIGLCTAIEIGKIIRRKFYSSEGMNYEF